MPSAPLPTICAAMSTAQQRLYKHVLSSAELAAGARLGEGAGGFLGGLGGRPIERLSQLEDEVRGLLAGCKVGQLSRWFSERFEGGVETIWGWNGDNRQWLEWVSRLKGEVGGPSFVSSCTAKLPIFFAIQHVAQDWSFALHLEDLALLLSVCAAALGSAWATLRNLLRATTLA